jgi:BirA family biotin operon repressor/biotin-[acetyl-CoA-carboxylase] ligase
MDISVWKESLEGLPLGELYLYQELGSTNQVAEELIHQDAPNFSLIVANSQTAGKGRTGRTWITNPGVALAFSLIIYPENSLINDNQLERLSGLGALAVADALNQKLGLDPQIKWPNDVLVGGKKVSGVLVDLHWSGSELHSVVIGIGINVHEGSVPESQLNFPAASLDDFLDPPTSRLDLMISVLQSLLTWYSRIRSNLYLPAWEGYLAYKGEQVSLLSGDKVIDQGFLVGLSDDGSLVISSETGQDRIYRTGEIHMRLIDSS